MFYVYIFIAHPDSLMNTTWYWFTWRLPRSGHYWTTQH